MFLHKSYIFGQIFVPKIWAKMFSANQIAGFFNHICRRDQWNSLIFCMLIQIPIKQKSIKNFCSGCGQHCVWPVCISVWKSVCVKLTLSQEWIDGVNWFFACWWKFRKVKNCLNAFWVGLVKTSFDYLANETVQPAEWVYELCWFFACWL